MFAALSRMTMAELLGRFLHPLEGHVASQRPYKRFPIEILFDKLVKMLYNFAMDTKKDLIKSTIRQLLKISTKYSRIESMPIQVNDGMAITTREAHVIQAIGEKKQMSVTDLAGHFGVTKSASSQIVTKLADKGYLQKSQAPHSNKELVLSLTELGWQAFRAHERFHGKDMEALIKHLDAYPMQQIATLSVLLEAIHATMNERLGEK